MMTNHFKMRKAAMLSDEKLQFLSLQNVKTNYLQIIRIAKMDAVSRDRKKIISGSVYDIKSENHVFRISVHRNFVFPRAEN